MMISGHHKLGNVALVGFDLHSGTRSKLTMTFWDRQVESQTERLMPNNIFSISIFSPGLDITALKFLCAVVWLTDVFRFCFPTWRSADAAQARRGAGWPVRWVSVSSRWEGVLKMLQRVTPEQQEWGNALGLPAHVVRRRVPWSPRGSAETAPLALLAWQRGRVRVSHFCSVSEWASCARGKTAS